MAAVTALVHALLMNTDPNVGYALCLDIGSQSLRAAFIDIDGNGPPAGRKAMPSRQADQAHRIDLDQLWASLDEVVAGLASDHPEQAALCRVVAATTQRATQVFLDAGYQPLAPAIGWQDSHRASPPSMPVPWRWLLGVAGKHESVEQMRQRAPAWVQKEQHPESWGSIRFSGLLGAWLNHRLSGQFVDCSQAQIGFLPYRHRQQRWAARGHWMFAALPFNRAMLPRLVDAGQPAATLDAALSRHWGLSTGLPVIACAGDKSVEALGTGCLHSATAVASMGTQITLHQPLARYRPPFPPWPLFPGARPGSHLAESELAISGLQFHTIARDWLAMSDKARHSGQPPEAILEEWILSADDSAQHTQALPRHYLDLAQHLAGEMADTLKALCHATGCPVEVLRLTGGLSQSQVVRQALLDRLEKVRVEVSDPDAGLIGVAITAWKGLSAQAWPTLIDRMVRPSAPQV